MLLLSRRISHLTTKVFGFAVIQLQKGELVVISCTGVFCLVKTDDVFSFSRVCILAPLRDGLGEWLILNDMWTVTNESPLLSLVSNFFRNWSSSSSATPWSDTIQYRTIRPYWRP